MFPISIGFFAAGGALSLISELDYDKIVLQDSPMAYFRMHDFKAPGYIYETTNTFNGFLIESNSDNPAWRQTGPLINQDSYAVYMDSTTSMDVYADDATKLANFVSDLGTGGGALEFWFKLDSLTADFEIVSLVENTQIDHYCRLRWDYTSDKLIFDFRDATSTPGNDYWTQETSVIGASAGQWYHLVIQQNGTGGIETYLDGISLTMTTTTGTPNGQWFGNITSYNILYFSGFSYNSGTTYYTTGYICEVAWYTSTLTRQKILEHYFRGTDEQFYMLSILSSYPNHLIRMDATSNSATDDYMNTYTGNSDTYTPNSVASFNNPGVPQDKDSVSIYHDGTGYTKSADIVTSLSNMTEGSIELWYKGSGSGGAILFCYSDEDSTNDYIYGKIDSTSCTFQFRKSTDSFGTDYYESVFANLDIEVDNTEWHHIVFASGASTVECWLDGVKLIQTSSQGTVSNNWFGDMNAGVDGINWSRFISSGTNALDDSYLTECSIYDYVLTQTEIEKHYKDGMFALPFQKKIFDMQPHSWWNFGSTSGLVKDYYNQNGNHLTINGSPTRNDTGPYAGSAAFTFDGTNDWLSINDSTYNSITGDMAIMCWVKVASAPTDDSNGIIAKHADYSGYTNQRSFNLGITQTNGYPEFIVSGDGVASISTTGSNSICDGEWHHVAGIYKPSTHIILLVDGVIVDKNTTSIPASLHDSTADLVIGTKADYTSASKRIDGSIAEPVLFNTTIDARDISLMYYMAQFPDNHEYVKQQIDDGAILVVPLTDPLNATTALAISESTNNGTFNYNEDSDIQRTKSPLGTAPWLDGTIDQLGGDAYDTLADTCTEGSIELWFRNFKQKVDANGTLLSFTEGTSSPDYVELAILGNGNISYVAKVSNTFAQQATCLGTAEEAPRGTVWHHIVYSVETGVGNNLYLDGKPVRNISYVYGSSSNTQFLSVMNTLSNIKLGARFVSSHPTWANWFRGAVCGLGIYDTPLTDAQIKSHYNATKAYMPAFINYQNTVLEDNPIAFWTLSEDSGDFINLSLLDNDLITHSGITYNQTSLIYDDESDNTCVDFDGTSNGYLSIDNVTEYQLDRSMGISLWIAMDDYTPTTEEVIVCCGGATGDGTATENYLYRFSVTTSGYIRCFWEYSTGTDEDNTGTVALGGSNGEVMHLGITRDHLTNNVLVYKNGILLDTIAYTNEANDGSNADLYFGINASDGNLNYNGKMQNIALFNKYVDGSVFLKHYEAGANLLE